MPSPRVSVVVPAHNRPELLEKLLESLAGQTLSSEDFEVIVVDDGSSPPIFAPPGTRLSVRVLRNEPGRGPAAARNRGWHAADGQLVAFTDDDCIPSSGWLEQLLQAWDATASRIVQGRTEPEEPDRVRPSSRTMEIGGTTGFFETCNIAYPRAMLREIGGFDEGFKRACGEDVDLGLRAVDAGAEVVFAPGALVRHAVFQPSLASMLRHARIWSDAVKALRLHPQLRGALVAGVFWKPSHPRLLVAAVALAIGARRRSILAVALGLAPYIRHYNRLYARSGESSSETLRKLPTHAIVDAVEVATLVEGSLRHRTLML